MTDGQTEILDDCRAAEKHSVVVTNGGKVMPKGRKLDPAIVLKIIEDRRAGDSCTTIAGRYGVSAKTVRDKLKMAADVTLHPYQPRPNSVVASEPWLMEHITRFGVLTKIIAAELADILAENPTMEQAEAAAEHIARSFRIVAKTQATLLAGERNEETLHSPKVVNF
jgi:uncharacterized protein (DUF433 family)